MISTNEFKTNVTCYILTAMPGKSLSPACKAW